MEKEIKTNLKATFIYGVLKLRAFLCSYTSVKKRSRFSNSVKKRGFESFSNISRWAQNWSTLTINIEWAQLFWARGNHLNLKFNLISCFRYNEACLEKEMSTIEILREKIGVCREYVKIFSEMCDIAGYRVKCIRGYTKGPNFVPGNNICIFWTRAMSFLPTAWWEKNGREWACLVKEENGEGGFWSKRNRSIDTLESRKRKILAPFLHAQPFGFVY